MGNKKTSGKGEGTLSCEAIVELIKKSESEDLSPLERNTIFEHCMRCKECRTTHMKVLNADIAAFEEETKDE